MYYNLENPLAIQNARTRLEALIAKKARVNITERKPARSLRQNAYLHTCLSYFATQYGETAEYVKTTFFKLHCNKDIFIRTKKDKTIGEVKYIRSSAELTSQEMNTAIDRFRHWASKEAGIYIPQPEEQELITLMQNEIETYPLPL